MNVHREEGGGVAFQYQNQFQTVTVHGSQWSMATHIPTICHVDSRRMALKQTPTHHRSNASLPCPLLPSTEKYEIVIIKL